jgi:hypothetical protein
MNSYTVEEDVIERVEDGMNKEDFEDENAVEDDVNTRSRMRRMRLNVRKTPRKKRWIQQKFSVSWRVLE